MWDTFTFRFYPAFWAGVFVAVAVFSEVSVNLLVVSGTPAMFALYLYAALLVALAVCPTRLSWLHPAGAALAALAVGGRAAGFAELVVASGSWTLVGAVAERVGMVLAMVIWHRAGVVRAERERARNVAE